MEFVAQGNQIPYEELSLGLQVQCSVTAAFRDISIGSKILGLSVCVCVCVVYWPYILGKNKCPKLQLITLSERSNPP